MLIGLAHALIAGVMFMPMMPEVHPRMTEQPLGVGTRHGGGTVAADDRGDAWVLLQAVGVTEPENAVAAQV